MAPAADAAAPVRVRIPSIGVDAPVGPLGLDAAGALEVPQDFDATGWYRAGPEPGERGPAVVVGHVDDATSPAVFYRLTDVSSGAGVYVDRADGSTAAFRVRRTERYGKDEFPADKVYGPTGNAQLRVITCGGAFDAATVRYLGNVVVYADLA